MKYSLGPQKLYIVPFKPTPDVTPHGLQWGAVAGWVVKEVRDFNAATGTYRVDFENDASTWVPETWLTEPQVVHRLQEMQTYQSQVSYSKLFQDLLWREAMGRAVKREVGDKVTIKTGDARIKAAFPADWNEIWSPACQGHPGRVAEVGRAISSITEQMHRWYTVKVYPNPKRPDMWAQMVWLGEDLI